MPLTFTYMGTKRQLSDQISGIIDRAAPGSCLDLFAGMSAVGRALAGSRNVWCNDIQEFAAIANAAFFTSLKGPAKDRSYLSAARSFFLENRTILTKRHATRLATERAALVSGNANLLAGHSEKLIAYCASSRGAKLRERYAKGQQSFPYTLFSSAYAGGYVGLQQAIDIDSLRYAIDKLLENGVIGTECHRWMLIALCYTLANISNSTGHFAQFLSVKQSSIKRFVAKRVRDVWKIWCSANQELKPLGQTSWRKQNEVFRYEAIDLLRHLYDLRRKPSVIYADPPYTSDHYSRYYHLWDTLALYDYPRMSSKGRYRDDRFFSPFSIKSQAVNAFKAMIQHAASLDAALVISYPDNGLVGNSLEVLAEELRRF
jgi:adenine-specific DNA-methyltransferase